MEPSPNSNYYHSISDYKNTSNSQSKEDSNTLYESSERKKRIRTTTVTQACNNCRAKHLKCDGEFPICGRCKKKDLPDCQYKATRMKRGPQPGKTKKSQLFQSVDHSANAIHQVKPSPQFDKMGSFKEIITSTNINEVLKKYLNIYISNFAPLYGVTNPDFSIDNLLKYDEKNELQLQEIPSDDDHKEKAMLVLAVLAHGALGHSMPAHASRLIELSYSLLNQLQDKVTYSTAATHLLICYSLLNDGEYERALDHSNIAIEQSKKILTENDYKYEYFVLYCTALLASAECCSDERDQAKTYQTVLRYIQESESDANTPSIYLSVIKIYALVRKIWIEATGRDRLGDVREYVRILQEAELTLPLALDDHTKKDIQSLLTSYCGGLLHIAGLYDLARKCADDVLASFSDISSFYSSLTIRALSITAQIHLFEGFPDKVQQSIVLLKQVGRLYPMAIRVVKQVIEPLLFGEQTNTQTWLQKKYLLYPENNGPHFPQLNHSRQSNSLIGVSFPLTTSPHLFPPPVVQQLSHPPQYPPMGFPSTSTLPYPSHYTESGYPPDYYHHIHNQYPNNNNNNNE